MANGPLLTTCSRPDEGNIPEGDDEQATIEPSAGESEFAYENDLRSYLAKNLRALQSGLRIYEEGSITGI